MIFVGADHRGFELKELVKNYLKEKAHEYTDLGALAIDPNDDYPDIAQKVAKSVSGDSKGIIFCGSGVGVDVVANKIDSIRAGFAHSKEQVIAARSDDDINILVIAADYIDLEKAKDMIESFLTTPFERNEKHERRLDKIKEIEKNN